MAIIVEVRWPKISNDIGILDFCPIITFCVVLIQGNVSILMGSWII